MKVYTYWECVNDKTPPPYVLLGIATMKYVYRDSFLLLTSKNVDDHIKFQVTSKEWKFRSHNKNISHETANIVAKSDYIRMAYAVENSGLWLDADTIVTGNLLSRLNNFEKLNWHSEAIFYSNKGNSILEEAVSCMEVSEFQTWGNPGGIKDLIDLNDNNIEKIPFKYINPGIVPTYSFSNCEMMISKDIEVNDFLTNNDANTIKIYNTGLSNTISHTEDVSDFLSNNTLMSRLFLSINNSKDFWIDITNDIKNELKQ